MLIPTPLRRVLRAIRHAPDRIAHPFRRRRLERELTARDRPRRVMFVCHGNICRSPYAAHAFERALAGAFEDMTILSAGFIGPSRPSPDAAIRVAGQLGVDLTEHRSVILTRELTADAALFLVMDTRQRRWLRRYFDVPFERVVILGDLDTNAIETRRIKDPIDQPDEEFRASYERIDRCLQTLVRVLTQAPASESAAPRRPVV